MRHVLTAQCKYFNYRLGSRSARLSQYAESFFTAAKLASNAILGILALVSRNSRSCERAHAFLIQYLNECLKSR